MSVDLFQLESICPRPHPPGITKKATTLRPNCMTQELPSPWFSSVNILENFWHAGCATHLSQGPSVIHPAVPTPSSIRRWEGVGNWLPPGHSAFRSCTASQVQTPTLPLIPQSTTQGWHNCTQRNIYMLIKSGSSRGSQLQKPTSDLPCTSWLTFTWVSWLSLFSTNPQVSFPPLDPVLASEPQTSRPSLLISPQDDWQGELPLPTRGTFKPAPAAMQLPWFQTPATIINGFFPSTGLNSTTPGALTPRALGHPCFNCSSQGFPQCKARRGSRYLLGSARSFNK